MNHRFSAVVVPLLACTVGCFNFNALELADVGGRCGDSDHWCQQDLICINKICARDGGGIAGDKCSGKLPCASEFACDAETGICRDPCKALTCGDSGTCVATDGVALCVCEPGFVNEQQRCVGTAGQVCGDTIQPCQAGLVCNVGRCAEPCGSSVCVNGMTCDTTQQPAACSCPSGSRFDSGRGQCVNVCTDVACSNHGMCVVDGGKAVCNCDSSYDPSGLDCVLHTCDPALANPTDHKVCNGGQWYWYDSCGLQRDLAESCGARGCTVGGCNPRAWTTRDVTFGGMTISSADFVIRSDGTLVAAASGGSTVAFRQRQPSPTGFWSQPSADISTGTSSVGKVRLDLRPTTSGEKLAAVYQVYQSIYYLEWTGTQWVGRGGPTTTPIVTNAYMLNDLALNTTGAPAVTYSVATGFPGFSVFILWWTGSGWASPGGSTTGFGGLAVSSVVGFDGGNNNLFVGWSDSVVGFYLSKWSGSTWSPLITAESLITNPSNLAFFGSGSMALAWPQAGGILLRQWTNEVPRGDAIVDGGRAGIYASDPSVVFDGQGNPIVAWYAHSSSTSYAIYVRHWDATAGVGGTGAWVELVTGSDSGAGLAGDYAGASAPRLRVNGSNVCVGWVPVTGTSTTYALQCTVL